MKKQLKENLTKLLNVTPKFWWATDYDIKPGQGADGVKALFFEGVEYKGNKTRVFAYYKAPKGKEGEKFPAVVLVHGGGGIAYPDWVERWASRGYAAIAIDTCGRLPKDKYKGIVVTEGREIDGKIVFSNHEEQEWAALDGVLDGYVSGPYNDEFTNTDKPLDEQWLYHALSALILGHGLLLSFPEVDETKTGIIGVSYGGILTSYAICFDQRYKVACPAYGSALLDFGGENEIRGGSGINRRAKEYNLDDIYDTATNIKNVNFPVHWSAWDKDGNFSIDMPSRCYLETKDKGGALSIIYNYDHSHCHVWVRDEIYKFVDSNLKGTEGLVKVVSEPQGFGKVSFEIERIESACDLKAVCFYLETPMSFNDKGAPDYEWKSVDGEIHGNTVFVQVPDSAKSYYVALIWHENREMVVSTSYVK